VAGVINTNRKFWFNVIPPQSQTMTGLESMEDSVRRSTLKHTCSHTDRREYEDRDAPTAEEIHKFIAAGGTVGAHTMFHPILTKCSEETAMFELKESKKVLEQLFKCNVSHFAYPCGAWNNTVRNSVGTAGFVSARATTSEWVTPKSDIFVLPSFGISDDAGLNKAIVQASGLWDLLKKLAHRR
jgi:peptidoglycan/xylan/chitin deacetylase (PgdA/CDA1 family)